MSNAPQGPGWWQASDGNWYPPQQSAGYTPPPPPPSWSAPAAYPQYPTPGRRTRGIANLPPAAWLLFAGLALNELAILLPFWTVSAEGETHDSRLKGGSWVVGLVVAGLFVWLIWATFAGPRIRTGRLITWTVGASLGVIGAILAFVLPSSGSLGAGGFVSAASVLLWVVGVIMAWNSWSKEQRRPY
jgi:hypothetical protein